MQAAAAAAGRGRRRSWRGGGDGAGGGGGGTRRPCTERLGRALGGAGPQPEQPIRAPRRSCVTSPRLYTLRDVRAPLPTNRGPGPWPQSRRAWVEARPLRTSPSGGLRRCEPVDEWQAERGHRQLEGERAVRGGRAICTARAPPRAAWQPGARTSAPRARGTRPTPAQLDRDPNPEPTQKSVGRRLDSPRPGLAGPVSEQARGRRSRVPRQCAGGRQRASTCFAELRPHRTQAFVRCFPEQEVEGGCGDWKVSEGCTTRHFRVYQTYLRAWLQSYSTFL